MCRCLFDLQGQQNNFLQEARGWLGSTQLNSQRWLKLLQSDPEWLILDSFNHSTIQ